MTWLPAVAQIFLCTVTLPEPASAQPPRSRAPRGSGGCNRLTGSYEVNGDRLTFGQMAGTMMACPEGMETEKVFLGALGQASTARITRQHLDLLDSAGNVVARFEARHMK